jgi:type II secretory ATPase GspE/PulE/Tfp pilus assembly ATPase PilB-like protein
VEFRKKVIAAGMEPMALNGLSKVKAGLTTIEEVMSVCAGDDEY